VFLLASEYKLSNFSSNFNHNFTFIIAPVS
jgi:hypothetical protein